LTHTSVFRGFCLRFRYILNVHTRTCHLHTISLLNWLTDIHREYIDFDALLAATTQVSSNLLLKCCYISIAALTRDSMIHMEASNTSSGTDIEVYGKRKGC